MNNLKIYNNFIPDWKGYDIKLVKKVKNYRIKQNDDIKKIPKDIINNKNIF